MVLPQALTGKRAPAAEPKTLPRMPELRRRVEHPRPACAGKHREGVALHRVRRRHDRGRRAVARNGALDGVVRHPLHCAGAGDAIDDAVVADERERVVERRHRFGGQEPMLDR